MSVINCGYDIDEDKFNMYAKETALFYTEHFNWFYMPRTVHQVLIHGCKVMSNFFIPLGALLSEEAQEARNKDHKYLREFHTRKTSRIASNEDLLHGLLSS